MIFTTFVQVIMRDGLQFCQIRYFDGYLLNCLAPSGTRVTIFSFEQVRLHLLPLIQLQLPSIDFNSSTWRWRRKAFFIIITIHNRRVWSPLGTTYYTIFMRTELSACVSFLSWEGRPEICKEDNKILRWIYTTRFYSSINKIAMDLWMRWAQCFWEDSST